MTVHITPDDEERVRPNEISEKSSDITYLKKDADAEKSPQNKVLNTLKELDTLYKPIMQNNNDPFMEWKLQGKERHKSHSNRG